MDARRAFQPLDVIHSEKAFAKVLIRSQKDDFCEWCMERKMNLKACIKCRAVKYCGINCQKSDWRDHKLECPYMTNIPNDRTQDYVRLLGRIILNNKWKNASVPFLNAVASFKDLKPYEVNMDEASLDILHVKEIKKHLERFIGAENIPEEDDMIEIIRKMFNNTIHRTFDLERVGLFLFLGSSCLERGCIPTAEYVIHKNVMKIIAIKEINKESGKMTINVNRLFWSGFKDYTDATIKTCKCVSCTLPYGKSLLTKILKEDEAFLSILETQAFLKKCDDIWGTNVKISDGKIIDELLEKQIGVFGDTNALHIRLLALKCFNHNCPPREMWTNLKKLEKIMSNVFGEFYLELLPIYENLIHTSMLLGKPAAGIPYMIKIKRIRDVLTI